MRCLTLASIPFACALVQTFCHPVRQPSDLPFVELQKSQGPVDAAKQGKGTEMLSSSIIHAAREYSSSSHDFNTVMGRGGVNDAAHELELLLPPNKQRGTIRKVQLSDPLLYFRKDLTQSEGETNQAFQRRKKQQDAHLKYWEKKQAKVLEGVPLNEQKAAWQAYLRDRRNKENMRGSVLSWMNKRNPAFKKPNNVIKKSLEKSQKSLAQLGVKPMTQKERNYISGQRQRMRHRLSILPNSVELKERAIALGLDPVTLKIDQWANADGLGGLLREASGKAVASSSYPLQMMQVPSSVLDQGDSSHQKGKRPREDMGMEGDDFEPPKTKPVRFEVDLNEAYEPGPNSPREDVESLVDEEVMHR